MWHRFTPELQALVFDALARGNTAATVSDLLAAMLAYPACNAAKILKRLRVTEKLRAELKAPETPPQKQATQFAPDASAAFRFCIEEAIQFKEMRIGSEHLLLAIARDKELGVPLHRLGVNYKKVRAVKSNFLRHGWDATTDQAPSTLGLPFHYMSGVVKVLRKNAALAKKVFVDLSIVNPRFISNPYPVYAKLRAEGVRRDPVIGFWIATRYDDVETVLRDGRFVRDFIKFVPPERSRHRLPDAIRQELCLIPEYLSNVMLLQDPPKHTRLRGLVNAAFTPRAIAEMNTRIQKISDELLDRVEARKDGEMDLIGDFAYPLPTVVICEMLGVPAGDRDKLKTWSDDVAGLLTSTSLISEDKRGAQSMLEIRDYFSEVIADLKQKPHRGLLSALIAAEAAGDKLSEIELYANAILLLAAGHETTTNLIGNGMLALLRNPEQLRKLRDDPSLMPAAIEELLRYDSPVQWTARIVSEDLELGGRSVKRGDFVLVSIGSANRDAAHFREPDRLDITRADNRHLAFGAGIHFCLGAALARMEGAIAIGTLLRRFPNMNLPSQRLTYRKSRPLRGLLKMRVRLK